MTTPFRVHLRDRRIPVPSDGTSAEISAHHLHPMVADSTPSPHEDLSLFTHESIDALDGLEEAWRLLTPASASPFQTYTWNLAWYRTYANGSVRPLLFELRRGETTLAILPCYREGRTIRLAGDRICDYQDVLAQDGDEVEALLREIRTWLDHSGRGCHFRFEKLSSEGALYAALHDPSRLPTHSLSFEKCYAPCPYTDLRGGLEGYLAALPRKMRQDLRHSLSRFDREAPDAKVTILRDYEVRVDDLWNAAAFHSAHFRKEGVSPFHDHRLIDLFARVAKDPEVGFQLSYLTLNGDFLAVDFGFVRGGRYFGYLTAFDAAFGRLAPGKCLLLKRIDRWVAEFGVHTLDFLAGDESYKRGFTGDTAYRVWSMRFMPDDLRNRVRQAGLESNRQIRELAKRALGRDSGLVR